MESMNAYNDGKRDAEQGTLNERLARIGLMVAPFMMYHLADSIYEKVLKPYNEKGS